MSITCHTGFRECLLLWSVSNKHSLNPVWQVMLISYYSANYQQLSPCQSSRWQILPISRLAVSSTGHELHVMETKSLALLTALTDKWGALEKLGPSVWAGEGKKSLSLPADLFFIRWERRLNTTDSVCMVCFQNMRIINGFCGGPV